MTKRIAIVPSILMLVLGLMTIDTTPASSTTIDPCSGGTLGYWPMDEGSGNVVHDICNGFNGSFSQGVSWGSDVEGPYLQFSPGDGPRVEVNAPALSQNTSLTVELRMQAVGFPYEETRVISQLLKPDGSVGARRWTLKLEGRQLEVWGETGSNGFPSSPFGSFPGGTNNWTHVAFQINGNQVWLYYDGVLMASGTLGSPQTLRSLAAITEFGAAERIFGFAGKIQYVRISSGIRSDFLLARSPTNQPPTADAGGPYTVDEGNSVILDASGSNDPEGGTLTFAWDLDNDGQFDDASGISTSFTGLDDGDFTVGLQVTDDSGSASIDTTTVTVINVTPVVNAGSDQNVDEGEVVSFTAVFTDTGALDTHSVLWDLGDGTIVTDTLVVSHTYADNGLFAVNLTVTDDDGGVGTDSINVAVNNIAPTANLTNNGPVPEGSTALVAFDGQTDSSAVDSAAGFLYSYDFDDDGIFEITASTQPSGIVPATFLLNGPGVQSIRARIEDKDGGFTDYTTTISITNVAPSVEAGADQNATEGDPLNFTGAFTDPGVLDTHTVLWSFGDGVTIAGTLTAAHTYADNGTYTVTLTVTDNDGGIDADTLTAVISNEAPAVDPPTVAPEPSDEGSPVTASATFGDSGVNDTPFTCTVNYGDGTEELPGTVSGNTCDGPAHTYADNGSYSVTASVTDKDGDTGSGASNHVVNNVAPIVGPITAPGEPIQVNTTLTATATFTDTGVLDTHSAVWSWGDGSTSAGTVNETNGSGTATGSHTYTTTGVYTVIATLTDNDGDSGQSVFEFIAVFDPSAGFVTGAGVIDSPAGAYTPEPSLTGLARFGFVSKYQKGATVPIGETHFMFNVAQLKFESTDYEWLVVAGAKAQFKGSGILTIMNNDQNGYKFLVTAIDAGINQNDSFEEDRFRIKIWTEDALGNETVIYDNGLEADIGDDNATTEIGGGSIVIHK